MNPDYLFSCTYPKGLETLFQCGGEDWKGLSLEYLRFFDHRYSNGDISLLRCLPKVEDIENLTYGDKQEVIEKLSRVDPNGWPEPEDIEEIDPGRLLEEESVEFDFLEDNLGSSQYLEETLAKVIKESFGREIHNIRSKKGNFPSQDNDFLQQEDGTFSGTFEYEKLVFLFEIAPTSKGWITTYRLSEKSLNELEKTNHRDPKGDTSLSPKRKVRSQSWR